MGTAIAEDATFESGGKDDERFIVFHRVGKRLVGAAALNEPRKIMKLRRLIADGGSWDEAVSLLTTFSVRK